MNEAARTRIGRVVFKSGGELRLLHEPDTSAVSDSMKSWLGDALSSRRGLPDAFVALALWSNPDDRGNPVYHIGMKTTHADFPFICLGDLAAMYYLVEVATYGIKAPPPADSAS